MHRLPLLTQLEKHLPADENEKTMLTEMLSFVRKFPDCFERTLLVGHVTASAWVLNTSRTHALLLHHKKLNKWFQPGGHCDGDGDTLAVARKEASEETGLTDFIAESRVFDVDIHPIPAHKGLPEHLHFDVRYLLVADSAAEAVGNSESNAVAWIPLEEVGQYNDSESILRMVRKVTPSN
jgi:8-oxo-dGTP pyrophosphatase MutT (NUDIX family)